MDENYLDNLLNEVSLDKEIDHKIEDELDKQIAKEKKQHQEEESVSDEDLFNLGLEEDSKIPSFDRDLMFSEDQMDELDELDNLADLDIGDLDFSDIDFNDLDMTKLDDIETDDLDDLLKEFEGDLEIEDSFDTLSEKGSLEEASMEEDNIQASSLETVEQGSLDNLFDSLQEEESVSEVSEEKKEEDTLSENLNEDSFDTEQFLDSLLEESEEEQAKEEPVVDLGEANGQDALQEEQQGESLDDLLELLDEPEPGLDASKQSEESDSLTMVETEENQNLEMADSSDGMEELGLSAADGDALDDLFSLLDLDEKESADSSSETAPSMMEGVDLSDLEDLEDIEELPQESGKAKKKSFMQVLFGDPDEEDELSEEELAAAEAKKAEKKAKKAAKKKAAEEAKQAKAEAAKADKEAKNGQKRKDEAEKRRIKAEKKAKKKAAAAAEAAAAVPEKPLNKPLVIFVFSLFLGGTFLFYLATNNFNYTLAIEKATAYFENQRYHKAYDEIKGVDVKEKDQELKDRIYTVMYVERLYEKYQNNLELGFPEKALDALLRGVDKYYEHYQEAEELGIVADLDFSFNQIQTVLMEKYGITLDRALEINAMENYQYIQVVREYVDGARDITGDENNTPEQNQDPIEGEIPDAMVPQTQEQEEEVVTQ